MWFVRPIAWTRSIRSARLLSTLARDRLGQKTGTGQPLVDRLWRRVRNRDVVLPCLAGVAKPRVDDDLDLLDTGGSAQGDRITAFKMGLV
jgi:hypothetical protein